MITLIQYKDAAYSILEDISPSEASKNIKAKLVNWIDLDISDSRLVEDTAHFFNIHHLIVEDILNLTHLPKFEAFEKHLFFSVKMLFWNKEEKKIAEEHLSIVMNENLLMTFQEGLPGDVFGRIRERIALGKGSIRKYGADYLFYHILDTIVDHYLSIMEAVRGKAEKLESEVLNEPSSKLMEEVMELKKDINLLRKYTLPLRDALSSLTVEGSSFVHKSSINYFQDVSHNLEYLISSFDTSREMIKDIIDLHHSTSSNQMNKVMKTLAVISAIFIPLTFIASVYGMNFEHMPELKWKWSYPSLLALMVVISVSLITVIKRKKWL